MQSAPSASGFRKLIDAAPPPPFRPSCEERRNFVSAFGTCSTRLQQFFQARTHPCRRFTHVLTFSTEPIFVCLTRSDRKMSHTTRLTSVLVSYKSTKQVSSLPNQINVYVPRGPYKSQYLQLSCRFFLSKFFFLPGTLLNLKN